MELSTSLPPSMQKLFSKSVDKRVYFLYSLRLARVRPGGTRGLPRRGLARTSAVMHPKGNGPICIPPVARWVSPSKPSAASCQGSRIGDLPGSVVKVRDLAKTPYVGSFLVRRGTQTEEGPQEHPGMAPRRPDPSQRTHR